MYMCSFVSRACSCNWHHCQAFIPGRKLLNSSPQRPRSVVVLPRRSLRANLPFESSSLLDDLCSGYQPRQLVALVRLSSVPTNEALFLLDKSETLTSSNTQVRLTALATLGKLGYRERAGVLVEALESDQDHSIRAAAANGLGNLLHPKEEEEGPVQGYGNALQALIRAAKEDEHFIVRYAALVALGELANPDALEIVLRVARDLAAPALEATAAVAAIGKMVGSTGVTAEVLEAVTARAADRDELIRAAVVHTLGRWSGVDSVPEVLRRMKEDEKRYGQSNHVNAVLDDVFREKGV